jgi:regulatory protein
MDEAGRLPRSEPGALDRAVRALARRDHSAASLREKLARSGVPEQEQSEALETLQRAGYVDDARFAAQRAELLALRGYGDEWIRGDLDAHGVARDLVTDALARLQPEAERAAREWVRLGDGLRAVRALARRGFSEDTLEALTAGSVAQDPTAGVG